MAQVIRVPEIRIEDSANVNIVSGMASIKLPVIAIGSGTDGLSLDLSGDFYGNQWFDIGKDSNAAIVAKTHQGWCKDAVGVWGCWQYTVYLGAGGIRFDQLNSGSIRPTMGGGEQLRVIGSAAYEFIDAEGNRYLTGSSPGWPDVTPGISCPDNKQAGAHCMAFVRRESPDGVVITYHFEGPSLALKGVTHSAGWALRYALRGDGKVGSVAALNLAFDSCTAGLQTCTTAAARPTASFNKLSTDLFSIQKPTGEVYSYGKVELKDQHGFHSGLLSVRDANIPTGSSATTFSYVYGDMISCTLYSSYIDCGQVRDRLISSASSGQSSWSYSYQNVYVGTGPGNADSPAYHNWVATATQPDGKVITVNYNSALSWVQSIRNGTEYATYDSEFGRMLTYSGVNGSFSFEYDSRGNLVRRHQTAVGGGTLTTEMGYDASCVHPAKCNKPNWVRDAMGHQTDYTYDPVHGGVLTETSPPDANGVRAQKRYTYVQRRAWLRNSSSGFSPSAPIWKLNSLSVCRSGPASPSGVGCALGTADEVLTTYEYGPDAGPNNLLLRGQVVLADGISRRTCFGYDALGNKTSETTPNAGLATCQ